MKKIYPLLLLLTISLVTTTTKAAEKSEEKPFGFKPYGFIRTDFYYNSRDCVASVNDIFNLYPYDTDYEVDANGEDLRDYSSSGFFAFITRAGLDVRTPDVFNAKATGKIEIDFGGYGTENTLLRLRQAYMNLAWESGSNLILGQTWHPLFGEVAPQMMNISTGAPFQPFSRSPQVRYSYLMDAGVKFTAAAMCQLQYKSNGPDGKSNSYQLHSGIPEFYAGVDYYSGGWMFGAGVDVLNIKPRTESTNDIGEIYKVDERMTSVSAEMHLRYRNSMWNIAAKSIYASALDHTTMLGGYGVSAIDSETGEQEYTPLHNSTTWINIIYGTKWQPSLFVGYTKNLGATKDIVDNTIYGSGTDIDQLLGCNAGLTYRLPHWSFGVEYSYTNAWYGDITVRGAVENTHSVCNHRVVSAVALYF